MQAQDGKLSAFVVSYNRADVVGTCLRGVRFADELIVVDKSSTDATGAIAASLADRVITVPWSPTVEETRAFAAEQCRHEWILFLDDDECLSPETAGFVRRELAAPRADAYAFPLRHYILGMHEERAYYWPEHHIRLFRRGALQFSGTVHAGIALQAAQVMQLPSESGVCIHHLSHRDTGQWIEKANRYTSRLDRKRVEHAGDDLFAFAQDRLQHWHARTQDSGADGYPAAVALLRAIYDLIDRLKIWEEERGVDGEARFRAICEQLDRTYAIPLGCGTARIAAATPPSPAPPDPAAALRDRVQDLRAENERLRRGREAAEARADAEQRRATEHDALRQQAEQRAQQVQGDLQMLQQSTFWRATAWPRALVQLLRGASDNNPARGG